MPMSLKCRLKNAKLPKKIYRKNSFLLHVPDTRNHFWGHLTLDGSNKTHRNFQEENQDGNLDNFREKNLWSNK